MPLTGIKFELSLLARMARNYRDLVLRDVGLDQAQLDAFKDASVRTAPDLLKLDVSTYMALLGPEVKTAHVDDVPEVLAGSTAHYFLLTLWPHLFWVVNRRPAGSSWGVEFQNQADLRSMRLDPTLVRVGVWTRSSLEMLAGDHEIQDGWDEEVIIRFRFDRHRYDGTFIFGLLQEWRKVD